MRWVGRELPGVEKKPLHPTTMIRTVTVDVDSGKSELTLPEVSSDPLAPFRVWPRIPADLDIAVFGAPGPQGSKVPGGRTKDGRITMRENSAKVRPWRDAVGSEFRRISWDEERRSLSPGWPLMGPLVVEMVFTMPKPVAASKKRRTFPATHRNDVSKLARSTEDSLKEFGAIEDDGMIIEYIRLSKVFPNEDRDALPVPGCVIRVWSVSRFLDSSVSGVN